MKINAVCLAACVLASVAPAAGADQHLVDSPVLKKILKTVDEAPTDEHLLDVTLRLLKGICECMTETLLVKQERISHADTSATSYTTETDRRTAQNTTWKELDLYQKIYNNTCFSLRNELAIKVGADHLERTKYENGTQSFVKTWKCGKQHEITTERIVMASTSMSPLLDDSLRPQLDNILFKILIVTKDYHTYKLRRHNLFGRHIPVTRNKKQHSIIVIVTLHPGQITTRNRKVPSENIGSLSETNRDKLDEIELNRTIYSKSVVDIDVFDTDFNLSEKESDGNNKNVVSKCVLLSIYKFLTESEINNHTKVFKLLRRKKSIKIYVEVMMSQGDGNYSGMCCDGDAITSSCTQQYIAKHLDIDKAQDNDQNMPKAKPIPKIEEKNSDYKDTIANIKNLLKLYDSELQKSTYYGKRVVVDNKLEGPKHGGHVGGDARMSVIDIFAKHRSVADHVTKSINLNNVEFATQLFSTTAPTAIQNIYTFKGFYDDELWDNTIPQETKTTGSKISFINDDDINKFQKPVPTKSNIYFLNVKKESPNKEYLGNTIKKEHVLPKVRTTRSTAIKDIQNDTTFETEKLSNMMVNHESTDQIDQTLNSFAVIPLNDSLKQTIDTQTGTEYSKDNKGSKIDYFQADSYLDETTKNQYQENIGNSETRSQKSNKNVMPTNKNLNDKINTITPITNNHKLISKVRLDLETETENVFKIPRDHKTTFDFVESLTDDNKRITKTHTISDQQKNADRNSNYLSRIIETSSMKQNYDNEQIYETTKNYDDGTSTELNYDNTVHNSQEDMDSSEKYKLALINSIIESIHPQQFIDYKNTGDSNMDKDLSNESLLLKNNESTTYLPDIHTDISSIVITKPSAEYVDFSLGSEEKHINKSFEIHSTYDDNKHLSVNLFESLIPLDPVITSNNITENVQFTTDYKILAEKVTEASVKLNESQDRNKLSYHAQAIKTSPIQNMNPIAQLVDKNLSTTENAVALTIISENHVASNPHTDSFEYATTIPVIVVPDKNNVFEVNFDKSLQTDESGHKKNLDDIENLNLVNGAVGIVLESKNKTPIHLTEKSFVKIMDSVTSNTEYTNIEQLEYITEPSWFNLNSNNGLIEEKLGTTSSSSETVKTTINSEVTDRDYTVTIFKNGETITSNRNDEKSNYITDNNDNTAFMTEKPYTATENIETGLDDRNINEINSYDTTATTTEIIDFTTKSASVISVEDIKKYNFGEHAAITNKETPETTGEGNKINYSEQMSTQKMGNDFVDAPESLIYAPLSLKKVEPLVVDRESSQIIELVSTTEKYTTGENFDKVLEIYTPEPIFPTNMQLPLKNLRGKPKNDVASAGEVITMNKNDVQASDFHTSTPTVHLNVEPLVYTKGKHLNKLKVTATTALIEPMNSKYLMSHEEETNDVDKTITNITQDTRGSQVNASVTHELLVHKEFGQIPELHKPTSSSTHIELLITNTNGKYIDDSVTISVTKYEESTTMKTLLQDTESVISLEKQDIEVVAGTTTSNTQTTSATEYVDYFVGSGEKYVNKSFQMYSTNDDQKYLSAKDREFVIPLEPITILHNPTSNVNFTTSYQNVEINKTDNSVLFNSHPEKTDKNKILSDDENGAYILNGKNNKSQDLSKKNHGIISPITKNIATKKSNTFPQVSEFGVPSLNVEPLLIYREEKPIVSAEKKITVTDKGFAQNLKSHTIAPTSATNAQYSEKYKEQQQNNGPMLVNDEKTDINEVKTPASVFPFVTLVSTIPTNVVPLFTSRTDKLVNGSISATGTKVTLNDKNLVQTLESRTKDQVDTIHKIVNGSAMEQIQINGNKDSVESVIETLDKTSTITSQVKELYSNLFYTEAAFLYTTTNSPTESKVTSLLTSTKTTISFNEAITKKNDAVDKQINETHTRPLNLSTEKNMPEDKLITSTIENNTVMKYYHTNQNDYTQKNLEFDMEETLFNEIEKEESAENNKRMKENLNEIAFENDSETTLRNSINQLHLTTKPNLETSTHKPFVSTILSSRDESVSLDVEKNNSVEMLIISTLPSLPERMPPTEDIVSKNNLIKFPITLKDNVANGLFVSKISDRSKLMTDTLDHLKTTIHVSENILTNEVDNTTNDIAASNLGFRLGFQEPSYHKYVDNITNVIENNNKSTLSYKYNESMDGNGVIISKIKQRVELKPINISDDILNKIILNDNRHRNANIPKPSLPIYSKNQEENDENIINQEKEIGGREPFIQNMTVNNPQTKLPQQTHQTLQKFLLFIKNVQNTQIKGSNFYVEGYNHTSLTQGSITEKIKLDLISTSLTSSAQDNSEVNEVTTLKNDKTTSYNDFIQQDSDPNAELGSRPSNLEFPKFKGQEGEEMNLLSILPVKETTQLTNKHITLKDDIEHESSIKLELQSEESILEHIGSKYQESKTPINGLTVISEENSLTTIENNLFGMETSKYPITINPNINKVIQLPQERGRAKKDKEQFGDTKEESESKDIKSENTELKDRENDTAYAKFTLIPLIITSGTSAKLEENLPQVETSNSPQFISENLKGNKMSAMRNKLPILKNSNKMKLEIETTEKQYEYTNSNGQINETLLTLDTSTLEDIKAEINLEDNGITTLANTKEQATLKYYFEHNNETKMDLKAKENKFEFTNLKDQDEKPHNLSTIISKEINTVVNFEVNETDTLNNDSLATLNDYNEQNRGTKVERGDKKNESKNTNSKNLKSETVENISTTFAKNITAGISAKLVNKLSKTESTTNVAKPIDVPNNDEFMLPLQATKDILHALSTSTSQEIKFEVNYLNEFTTSNNDTTEPKDYTEQENKSEQTEFSKMKITTWRNENKEFIEDHITQDYATKTELEGKENESNYKEFKNQENEILTLIFASIAKTNTAEVMKNLSKIETTTYVIPKGTYLPNNHKFTLPVAVTEGILYRLYTSTPEDIKKEIYSGANEIITLKHEDNTTSPEYRIKNDNEIMVTQEAKKNISTEYIKLQNHESGKNNETPISAAKETTAGILAKVMKDPSTIETGINITDVPYYDKFTYPLAETENIINALSTLNQQDVLEVNTEENVINTLSVMLKDQVEQKKRELKIQENEILNSMSSFIPKEIKTEKKFEVNKITTMVNKVPVQQDQIEQNHGNTTSKNIEFKNRLDGRPQAISTSIFNEMTNTLGTLVDDIHETQTTTDVNEYSSTRIYNSDVVNNADITLPLKVTDDILTSKIMEKVTNIKMTSDIEHVDQGNVLNNPGFANNNEVNNIEMFPKPKYVILGDFTVVIRIKPTLSIDIENKKERNIGSFTLDHNKRNHETFKSITEYTKEPTREGDDNNAFKPARIEKVVTTTDFGSEDGKFKNMFTTGLHKTLPKMIEDKNNINKKTINIILMDDSVSNNIESLNAETAVDKISSTKSLLLEKKNTESPINREENILSIKATTEKQHFMRKTVPQKISKEAFSNLITGPRMLEDYHGTAPVTENIPSRGTEKSTLLNLGEETINYVESEKESFTITLPKPLLEKVKMMGHLTYEPRADLNEKYFTNAEDKYVITNGFLKMANTNVDFESTMKKYNVSISTLKPNIDHKNGTNEKENVFTDTLKPTEKILLQDTDTHDIQKNIVIKKSNTTRMKYPTLIYTPESYLDHRLNIESNNLGSNHDSLASETNDSLQKKYSNEANEVLSELAAVLNSNCNSTNKVPPSEICYTNILASIEHGNNNLPSDDPAIVTSRHINVPEGKAEAVNTSSVSQKTSPVAKKIMSKGFANPTHSDSHITELKISNLTTYAKQMDPNKKSSQHDTYETEHSEPLHLTVLDKISSVNSQNTKDDDFKKAIVIASAFKNMDILLRKSGESVSNQEKTKSLNAESSPMKVQSLTRILANKAPKNRYNAAVVANSTNSSLGLNDSKIYYIPFMSNAAFNKPTLETSLNITDYMANAMKQELVSANLKIENETHNNLNTEKSLHPKDNKIQSISFPLNSNMKPQSYKINENLYDPTETTRIASIKEHTFDGNDKSVNIKPVENDVVSKTKSFEDVTFIKTKENNNMTESLTTFDKTFNNSALELTDVNLSSSPVKYERGKINNDTDFQEKRDFLNNINKSDDSINLKRNKFMSMDEISPSTIKISTIITRNTSESSENNYAASRAINLKTSVLVNKITRALSKDEKLDHYGPKANRHENDLPNLNNILIENESTKSKYVTLVLSYGYSPQLFTKSISSKELKQAVTSPVPKAEIKQFFIMPDKISRDTLYFPAPTKAAYEVTKTPINAETGEPYLLRTVIQDLWNSLQDMTDKSAERIVNTIQTNQPVSNAGTVKTLLHTGKLPSPTTELDVNYHLRASSTKDFKLSQQSYTQIPEYLGNYETVKHLLTNAEVIKKSSKKQIRKGYVPIMILTHTPINSLITKPVHNIIQVNTTYKPLLSTEFDWYTTKINRQTFDTESEKRNDYSSAYNYKSNLTKHINESTTFGGNIEISGTKLHLVPEIVERVTNNDSVSSMMPGKGETMLIQRLYSKDMNNGKPDIYNTLTNAYSTTKKDKESIKNSTPMKQSLVVDNKYENYLLATNMLRFFLQATHSYSNIRPTTTTVRSTVERISYSTLSDETVTRSTKKIMRHRNTKHPKTNANTTTGPRRTTIRKKRRRTRKRIVYNTYEPTMYEDLDMAYTKVLRKKVTQVKPPRANGEEEFGELLKSSDHVHIGDVTAILPWPAYFPTPSTTRQLNVRGKLELSHILRQTKRKNTDSASNKSMNTVGNMNMKVKPRPTRLHVFNALYKNHMDTTERMTSSPGPHIDSVPVIVSILGPKSTRLVKFNHYETVTTMEPTRLLKDEIYNNMKATPVQPIQIIFRKSSVRNAFTSTLLPPETPKQKKIIYRLATRKPEKKLTFYQGFGKIYEKPTHFPLFGDIYMRTTDTTKNVQSPTIHNNINKAARNENKIAEDKITAFMKATRASNMKILLFRKNDPKVSKINQFQTKKIMTDITNSPYVKRGPTATFAAKRLQLSKKKKTKMGASGKKLLRTKFAPSNVEVESTIDTNVDFTNIDHISLNAQKKSDVIKKVINKSQRIKGILMDPLDPSYKSMLHPVKVIPKVKLKKVHYSVVEKNLLTTNREELLFSNMMTTARINFFDELAARNNIQTYIVRSAKPLLSRQILLRPKFANIDNVVRITQIPPFETTKKYTHSKLKAIDFFQQRKPFMLNLLQNKKEFRALAPSTWDNNVNVLEKPHYFPIMNGINSESKYRMPTRGFLVPEGKYFLESLMESSREAAMPSPAPTRYQMHYVTPLKPRRSRRTIYFLSPTASYIQYFK